MRVYVASPLGFSEPTRLFYTAVLLPGLIAAGAEPIDPWSDAEPFTAALAIADPMQRAEALGNANRRAGARNAESIRRCDAVLAILDGPDVDSGTAAEIGYAAALGIPVVGWRSDLRQSGDNDQTVVNLQVEYFIEASGGRIERDLDDAVAAVVAMARFPRH